MKRYNKSEIMKSAWRLFKMRIFKSFSEALKNAWSVAIEEVKVQMRKESFKNEMNAPKQVINRDSVFNNLNIDSSAFYSNKRFGNGRFVND